jgi:hypothetical protein
LKIESRFERDVDGEGALDIVDRSECGWGRADYGRAVSRANRCVDDALEIEPVINIGTGIGRKTYCAARLPCAASIS